MLPGSFAGVIFYQAEKEGTVESLGLWTAVGRPADGRPIVVSGAKKKSFDRGDPDWPPRSITIKDYRLAGVWGAVPPSQNRTNLKKY